MHIATIKMIAISVVCNGHLLNIPWIDKCFWKLHGLIAPDTMKKPFVLVDKDFHENNGEFTESIQCEHVASYNG